MTNNLRIILLCASLVALIAATSGCTQRKTNNQASLPLTGTCAQLGGYVCNDTQDCNGTWLNATDTFRCCSCECGIAAANASLLTDTFDELTSDNDTLGDIQ